MKKIIKSGFVFVVAIMIAVLMCACGENKSKECSVAETVKLQNVVLNEVEFENSETVELKQECDEVKISGSIDAMTNAQKSVFGDSDVTHVVALNIVYDKERTLASVEIKGSVTKVYSTNKEDANYVGSLTDLLDNESGEDAYSNLVLSANTSKYTITIKYTDATESVISINITASLATANS